MRRLGPGQATGPLSKHDRHGRARARTHTALAGMFGTYKVAPKIQGNKVAALASAANAEKDHPRQEGVNRKPWEG